MPNHRIFPALAVMALSAACQDAASTSAATEPSAEEVPRPTVVDSAGVSIVTTSELPWGDEPLRLDPAPLISLDGEEDGGDPFYRLGETTWMPDGTIVVGEAGPKRLRMYSPDGRLLGSFGRDGAGPGDFGAVNELSVAGDTLWVHDSRYSKLHKVIWDGTAFAFEQMITYARAGGLGHPRFMERFGDGRLLTEGSVPSDEGLPRGSRALAIHEPSGTFVTRVDAQVPIRPGATLVAVGSTHAIDDPVFEPTPAVGVHREGLVVAPGATYRVDFLDQGGAPARSFRFDQLPRKLTPAMKSAWATKLRGDESNPTVERMIEGAVFPDHLPAFGPAGTFDRRPDAILAEDGRVWVRAYTALWDRTTRWWVIDPELGFLGSALMPEGFELHRVGIDRVMGVRMDELDIEYLEVYRLVQPY